MDTARAVIAGALTMVFGIWLLDPDKSLTIEQVLGGVLLMLAVVALLVGVDLRGRRDKE